VRESAVNSYALFRVREFPSRFSTVARRDPLCLPAPSSTSCSVIFGRCWSTRRTPTSPPLVGTLLKQEPAREDTASSLCRACTFTCDLCLAITHSPVTPASGSLPGDTWQDAWENILLCLIGESFDPKSVVNGACIIDKVCRWLQLVQLPNTRP
jgi:hypothetical protein